jgi:hypothetical protein
MAGLDPATPISEARPCNMIGIAGSSPAMTGAYFACRLIHASNATALLCCSSRAP